MTTETTKNNTLGYMLMVGGAMLTVAAMVWWGYVYINGMEAKVSEAIGCLFVSSGECAVANGLVELGGHTPYNPVVFWVGLVVLVIGTIMHTNNKTV